MKLAVAPDAIKAGIKADLIKQIAPLVGGGSGGLSPDMAQAGGKNPAGIPDALAAAKNS